MALFRIQVDVDSFLQLDAGQRDQFRRLVQATESIAASLVAILAKVNEPDPPQIPPELEAAATQLGVTTEALRTALAAAQPESP